MAALFFSNTVALWIYLGGTVFACVRVVHELRHRGILYNLQGPAAVLSLALGMSQGGMRGRVSKYLSAVLSILLWPSQLAPLALSIVYSWRSKSKLFAQSHLELLVPKYLLLAPVLLGLALITYYEVSTDDRTLLTMVFTALTTLCAIFYMAGIGITSFREFISRNLTAPAVNAVLIAVQLCLIVIFLVANLLGFTQAGNHSFAEGATQVFSFSQLGDAFERAILGFFVDEGPRWNALLSLVILIVIGLFYLTVIKTLSSGLILGRTDAGRLAVADYWRVVGNFGSANAILKPVDSKNPLKQSLVLVIQIAQEQGAGLFQTASKLLKLIDADDTTDNRAAIIAGSIAGALVGTVGESMKQFARALIHSFRSLNVHDALSAGVLRDLYLAGRISETDIEEIKAELCAEQPENFLWQHLELVVASGGSPEILSPRHLLAGRSLIGREADLLSRATYLWALFMVMKLAPYFRDQLGEPLGDDDPIPGADGYIRTVLAEVYAARHGREMWEAFALLNSVGVAIQIIASLGGEDDLVGSEQVEAVDEWINQLSNEGLPGMAEFDLTALTVELSK